MTPRLAKVPTTESGAATTIIAPGLGNKTRYVQGGIAPKHSGAYPAAVPSVHGETFAIATSFCIPDASFRRDNFATSAVYQDPGNSTGQPDQSDGVFSRESCLPSILLDLLNKIQQATPRILTRHMRLARLATHPVALFTVSASSTCLALRLTKLQMLPHPPYIKH